MSNRMQVKVLSIRCETTFPCISISTDAQQFLIDAGEGTQRLCIEQKVKLVKLSGVLLTRLSPETHGGLPGLCLTAIDSGITELDVIAPPGYGKIWFSMRFLLRRPDFKMRILDSAPRLHDDVGGATPQQFQTGLGQPALKYGQSHNPDVCVYNRAYRGSNGAVLVCYVIATREQPGKFDIAAAKALGIPPGPLYAKLKSGEPVEFEKQVPIREQQDDASDGRAVDEPPGYEMAPPQSANKKAKTADYAPATGSAGKTKTVKVTVYPSQVLGPPLSGRHAIVLADFTGEPEALEEMCADPTWAMFRAHGDIATAPALECDSVIHFSSAGVLRTACYADWIRKLNEAPLGARPVHLGCGLGAAVPMSAFIDATRYCNKLHAVTAAALAITGDVAQSSIENARCNVFTRLQLLSLSATTTATAAVEAPAEIVQGYPSLLQTKKSEIESTRKLDASLDSDVDAFVAKFRDTPDPTFTALAKNVKAQLEMFRSMQEVSTDPASSFARCRLSFLGTGSAIPSKYRNVTGIILQIPAAEPPAGLSIAPLSLPLTAESCEHRSILLDCGEGSWQQLLRLAENNARIAGDVERDGPVDGSPYEQSLGARLISRIGVVWVSHPHADHHLGLTRLLSERVRLMKSMAQHTDIEIDPLVIIASPSILNFLADYSAIVPTVARAFLAVSTCWLDGNHVEPEVRFQHKNRQYYLSRPTDRQCLDDLQRSIGILNSMGIEDVLNTPVEHCPESYGVRLNLKGANPVNPNERMSVVYSGDCKPCDQLAFLAADCDVLIHECSFGDSKEDQAYDKNHSTISQALRIGLQSRAKTTILTHFSQRYSGVPPPPRSPSEAEDSGESGAASLSVLAKGYTQAQVVEYFQKKAILAFDFMSFTVSDTQWLPALNPVLLHAFPTDDEAGEGEGEGEGDGKVEVEAKVDPQKPAASSQKQASASGVMPFAFVRKASAGGGGCLCCDDGKHSAIAKAREAEEDDYRTSTTFGERVRDSGLKKRGSKQRPP